MYDAVHIWQALVGQAWSSPPRWSYFALVTPKLVPLERSCDICGEWRLFGSGLNVFVRCSTSLWCCKTFCWHTGCDHFSNLIFSTPTILGARDNTICVVGNISSRSGNVRALSALDCHFSRENHFWRMYRARCTIKGTWRHFCSCGAESLCRRKYLFGMYGKWRAIRLWNVCLFYASSKSESDGNTPPTGWRCVRQNQPTLRREPVLIIWLVTVNSRVMPVTFIALD